jgi:hypothetical protein
LMMLTVFIWWCVYKTQILHNVLSVFWLQWGGGRRGGGRKHCFFSSAVTENTKKVEGKRKRWNFHLQLLKQNSSISPWWEKSLRLSYLLDEVGRYRTDAKYGTGYHLYQTL